MARPPRLAFPGAAYCVTARRRWLERRSSAALAAAGPVLGRWGESVGARMSRGRKAAAVMVCLAPPRGWWRWRQRTPASSLSAIASRYVLSVLEVRELPRDGPKVGK